MNAIPKELSWETTALPERHLGSGHIYIVEPGGKKVATVWGAQDRKVSLADLFSAAPALFDAAVDVVNLMDDTAKQDSGAYTAFLRLEAAIAKATGAA